MAPRVLGVLWGRQMTPRAPLTPPHPSPSASITLSDAAAAERALQRLQCCTLRRHRLHAEVQPCSALLCVAHLPQRCSQQPWEALVRPYGAVGRCWLVHSRASGRCKGYGFVEYLHEEAAVAAQAELQGRALGAQVLFVRWCDAGGELMEEEDLHSRCLCVEGLPRGYTDGEGLRRVFSGVCGPKFCQVRGEGGCGVGGFLLGDMGVRRGSGSLLGVCGPEFCQVWGREGLRGGETGMGSGFGGGKGAGE